MYIYTTKDFAYFSSCAFTYPDVVLFVHEKICVHKTYRTFESSTFSCRNVLEYQADVAFWLVMYEFLVETACVPASFVQLGF